MTFSLSDYVYVLPGVHEDGMPSDGCRKGLVVEIVGKRKDQFVIMFHNKVCLKFHKSQLNLVKSRHLSYNR